VNEPRPSPVPDVSLARKLSFAALITLVALALIEGAARITQRVRGAPPAAPASADTNWLGILERDLPLEDPAARLYARDRQLFWTLRPRTNLRVENSVYRTRGEPIRWSIAINADGFRGRPLTDTASDAKPVVAAFGDSCTFGFRVDDGDTYPAQLERRLVEGGWPGAAVLNYGVPGYTSFQGRRLLDGVLQRRAPDFVILAFGANDLEADRYSDAEKARRGVGWRARLRPLLDRSAAVRMLRGTPAAARTAPGDRAPTAVRVSDAEYRENLRAMIAAARDAGSRVLLLDLVFVSPVFRPALRDLAAAEGVVRIAGPDVLGRGLADLLAGHRFRDERAAIDRFWEEEVESYREVYYPPRFYARLRADPHWRDLLRYLMIEPVHPNALGQQLIAEAVGDWILGEFGPPHPRR